MPVRSVWLGDGRAVRGRCAVGLYGTVLAKWVGGEVCGVLLGGVGRAGTVDEWLAEKMTAFKAQGAKRRDEQCRPGWTVGSG